MNRLEDNCAAAIKSYLITAAPTSIEDAAWLTRLAAAAAIVAALPATSWDISEEATIPRLALTVTQGEEVVYPMGVYSLSISLETVVRAKKNVAHSIDGAIQELLGDVGELAVELSTAHFWCYGRTSGLTRKVESGDGKRHMTISFDVYGFDLDRFPTTPVLGDNAGNEIDFGGGVVLDVS